MDGSIEQQIRRRAYELWMQGGMADGYDREHWHIAERELAMHHEHAAPAKPARSATRKSGATKAAAPRKTSATKSVSGSKTGTKKSVVCGEASA